MKGRIRFVFARFFVVLFAVMFAVCQGPEGPAGPKGDQGEPGLQGDPGVSIVWKGELASAPASPKQNWAYFNKADGNAYIYTGTAWEKLAQSGAAGAAGAAGDDGVSIDWRGTLSRHPTRAQLNWAYYNSTDKKSYIYDGEEWQVLAIDGVAGSPGEKGDKGDTGAQGEKGGKGDTGAQGEKGDKGDTGSQGEKGDKGDPNGPQGPKGADGANGTNGADGDDGKDVYLVIFNSLGGEPAIDAVGVNHGSTVSALEFDPPAGLSSYVAEWYTDKEFNTPYNFSAPVTRNLTLYANWALPPVEMIMLNENVTMTGSITYSVREVWYSMAVTSGVRYNVYWGNTYNGDGTVDVTVAAYYRSNGNQIFDSDNSYGYQFIASSTGTVEIRVYRYSSGIGMFTIEYSVSTVVPPSATYGPNVSYGGETYQTVVIGTQTWFARNLNYNVSGSVCYNNDPSNCATYGRLYDWATAMNIGASYNSSSWNGSDVNHQGVCPVGWHIPSDADWTTLTNAVGGRWYAGTKLKSTSGWYSYGNGTDDYGFSALSGGYNNYRGDIINPGYYGLWWSATEYYAGTAWYRYMNHDNEDVNRDDYGRYGLLSVRCVQD